MIPRQPVRSSSAVPTSPMCTQAISANLLIVALSILFLMLISQPVLCRMAPETTAGESGGPLSPVNDVLVAPDPVRSLLALHLDALGGEEVIRSVRSSRITASISAFGLEGTSVSWTRSPNLIRNELDLGLITQIALYDGEEAWKIDQNGKASRLEGMERDALLVEALFGNFLYCFPDESGAEYQYRGPAEIEGQSLNTLEVIPPGGSPVTIYFDVESSLIVRTEMDLDVVEAHTVYQDYRRVDGIPIPFLSRQSTGDSRFDVVSRLTDVTFNPALEDSHFSFTHGEGNPGDCTFTSGDRADGIPLRVSGGHIFLEAAVNGVPGMIFMLDTGSSASVLNLGTAEALGLETFGTLQVAGAGGRDVASFITVDSIKLPGLEISGQRLIAVDLDPLTPAVGMRVDGLLGYDFISRLVLKIDYEKGSLCVHRPSSFTYEGDGKILDISLDGNVPLVRGVVEKKREGLFLLDSGANVALALNKHFVDFHRLLKWRRGKREAYTGGVGGVVRQVTARLKTFELGSFVFESVPTYFSQEESSGVAGRRRISGIIGGVLLNHFTIYLDYGNRRIILEPNGLFHMPFPADRSGLQLALDGLEILIAGVVKGSAGRRAGMRSGDRILEIDGLKAGSLGLDSIRQRLQGPPGTSVTLVVLRGGKRRSASFELQEY